VLLALVLPALVLPALALPAPVLPALVNSSITWHKSKQHSIAQQRKSSNTLALQLKSKQHISR
jgi:hypothetical protein